MREFQLGDGTVEALVVSEYGCREQDAGVREFHAGFQESVFRKARVYGNKRTGFRESNAGVRELKSA